MNVLRKHWYDIGAFIAVVAAIYVVLNYPDLTQYELVMWSSLISLFLHQLEEYRFPGSFPGMLNTVFYKSNFPDRFPLNTHTAFLINACLGWTVYFLAAFLGEKAIWLGIATMFISFGNVIVHTFVFNIKGKTYYNAGLVTSLLLFAPLIYLFFTLIHTEELVTRTDYYLGIPLGILSAAGGILKMIEWGADENTEYIFDERNLIAVLRDRNIR